MLLPEINDDHVSFVLTYTKKSGEGLYSLVKNLDLSEDKTHLEADLQADLIQSFATEFPDVDLEELDKTVQWVLIMSIANSKEEKDE